MTLPKYSAYCCCLSAGMVEKGAWIVRKYNDQHTCLQSRALKHFDLNFISKQIKDKIQTNPRIPVKSVHNQLTNQFELEVSMQKVLRAKRIAVRGIRKEFKLQFTMLRDYVQELQKRNPNTTVVIHVERPAEDTLPTREFKRLYVCLGALKEGFKACQRQLLGINAYPIDGPLKGHLLTTVGIDSNNGIYPLAYAFAESENTIAWTWFLNCLSDDLEIEPNSIFTFVTGMKGTPIN